MTPLNKIKEKTQDIKILRKKTKKLEEDLDLSLSIQDIWPDAFNYGQVKSRLVGNYLNPKDMKVIFRNEKETKEFKLTELPTPLKKQKIKQIYNQAAAAQKPFIARYIETMGE